MKFNFLIKIHNQKTIVYQECSGYEFFRIYTNRIGRATDKVCVYCWEINSAEHALMKYEMDEWKRMEENEHDNRKARTIAKNRKYVVEVIKRNKREERCKKRGSVSIHKKIIRKISGISDVCSRSFLGYHTGSIDDVCLDWRAELDEMFSTL